MVMYKNTRIGEVLYCNKVQHNGVLPTSLFYEHYSQNNCEIQYWVCKGVQLKQEVRLKSLPEFSLTVNNQTKIVYVIPKYDGRSFILPVFKYSLCYSSKFHPNIIFRAAITELI